MADKIPEFTITSQALRQNDAWAKPSEDKENANSPHPTKQHMDYDIMEDLKKIKVNVPLFEMCKLPQQKERLLRSLEALDERMPANSQPKEEE